MCDPVSLSLAAATVLTAGSQVYGGMVANAQGKYEQAVAKENRKHELAARDDANQRRTIEQMRHWRRVSQMLGEQRAEGAALGLDVNFGSMADLQEDTMMIGYEDSAILNQNFDKEVKGYEINAANYTMQGRAARQRGKGALIGGLLSAGGTILGGASQIGQYRAGMGSASGATASFGSTGGAYGTRSGSWTGPRP